MRNVMARLFANALAAFAISTAAFAADAIDSLRTWVSVEGLNLGELATGNIATSKNASMSLARGMSCQAVFVVNAPIETTYSALLKFNPVKHPELESYQHHVFHDEKDWGFDKLVLNPKDGATAKLIRSMGDASEIQLSKTEAAQMPRTRTADAARAFLIGVMRDRWTQFSKAGDFGKVGTHDAGGELRSLLTEEGKMTKRFGALLAPLAAKGAPGAPLFSYWDLSVVDKKAAVSLGAVYVANMPDKRQVLDVTWYSSNGYLVTFTLYEMHPVTIGGKACTLVWQASLVSTTGIEGGLGLKRKIGSGMMVSDVERGIRIFRSDAEKGGG